MCHYGSDYNIYSDGLIYPQDEIMPESCQNFYNKQVRNMKSQYGRMMSLKRNTFIEHFVENNNKILLMH